MCEFFIIIGVVIFLIATLLLNIHKMGMSSKTRTKPIYVQYSISKYKLFKN